MNRFAPRLAVLAVVASTVLILGGCSDDSNESADEPTRSESSVTSAESGAVESDAGADVPVTPALDLIEGSEIELPATQDSTSLVLTTTPALVGFDAIECKETFEDLGVTFDSSGNVDLSADAGNQLCLVKLSVTNIAKEPIGFQGQYGATLLVGGGYEYSVTDKSWDDQGIINQDGREPSTVGGLQPNETAYDYLMFEVPADAEPMTLLFQITTAD